MRLFYPQYKNWFGLWGYMTFDDNHYAPASFFTLEEAKEFVSERIYQQKQKDEIRYHEVE